MKGIIPLSAAVILPALAFLFFSHAAEPVSFSPGHAYTRVVSLSPSLSRMAHALGRSESIIGITSYDSTFSGKAIIGTVTNPSVESIVALRPDLVIASEEDGAVQCVEPLAGARIPVLILPRSRTFEDIVDRFLSVGAVLGEKATASLMADDYRNRMKPVKPNGMKTLFLISNDPLVASSRNSFIGKIIESAGGICAEEGYGNPFPIISREHLIALNPDAVVSVIEDGGTDILSRFKSFSALSFVKNRAALFIPSETACYYTPEDFITTRAILISFYGRNAR